MIQLMRLKGLEATETLKFNLVGMTILQLEKVRTSAGYIRILHILKFDVEVCVSLLEVPF